MASSPHVIEATDRSFQSDVVERSKERPVVVDFWAPWCGPCKTLGPVLEKLADAAGGDWVLAKVNVDENQESARSHNVRGIPAVKAFVDGEIVDEFTGAKPRAAVERWLEEFVPSESDEKLDEARSALEAGELNKAESLFEEIREADPRSIEAKIGLADVALKRGHYDDAAALLNEVPEGLESEAEGKFEETWVAVEAARADDTAKLRDRVETNPDDLDARYELAMALAADEEFTPAFEQLLEIIKRDRNFRDDLGRRAMIRLFDVIGPDSEMVREWRQKMGRAMY